MGWNYLSIFRQTSTAQPLPFGMDKWFHTTLYWVCGCLSMLGLKLIHVSKRGPGTSALSDIILILFDAVYVWLKHIFLRNVGFFSQSLVDQICHIKSLWPNDAIWWQRSGSTLAQVMACCLTAPSHYLNQCWLTISKVHWHSFEYSFTRDTSAINH